MTDEPQITFDEVHPTTRQYQPLHDQNWRIVEAEDVYVARMRAGPLPNWPVEPLKEWLHRHANQMEDYAFLGFEGFQFELETWDLSQIPGREAFKDEQFCDNFQDVEGRAADNQHDWLAHYMLREGTWNTPIVLLDNRRAPGFLHEPKLKMPYHLLEGHRRLSFLQGLRRLGKARAQHTVWIVRRPDNQTLPTGDRT
jgi:hypothetical protein